MIACEAGSHLELEAVPGRSLLEKWSRRALRELGTALRTLHEDRYPGPPWLEHVNEQFGWALENAPFDEAVIGAARRVFDDFQMLLADAPHDHLLHGDLQVGHVFADDDGALVGIIDWGDAHVGDPAWDIAVLGSWVPQAVPHVLDGYEADAAFRGRFDALFPRYRLYRHIWGYRVGTEGGWDESERIPIIRSLVEQLR